MNQMTSLFLGRVDKLFLISDDPYRHGWAPYRTYRWKAVLKRLFQTTIYPLSSIHPAIVSRSTSHNSIKAFVTSQQFSYHYVTFLNGPHYVKHRI